MEEQKMNKNNLLMLLLISAICLLVNAVAGWLLLNLGGLASAVLSLIFFLNVRKFFGAEGDGARTSCLANLITNGAIFLLGNTLGIVLAIVTLGITAIFTGVLVFLVDIGFGIWQLVLWNQLKTTVQAPAQAV
jgi:hypothetical protein